MAHLSEAKSRRVEEQCEGAPSGRECVPALSRIEGALLGVAIGDALGLPYEGLGPERIPVNAGASYALVGRRGYVSDDTEQSALLAEALIVGGEDDVRVLRAFRCALGAWFLRLPFGVGLGTLRACLRILVGVRKPGVNSAGNGAAMRAGVLGVLLSGDDARRWRLGRRIARLTHRDERAVEGAVFVAEVAALCMTLRGTPREIVGRAAARVQNQAVVEAIHRGLAQDEALPNSGYVLHTVALCTALWVRHGHDPHGAMRAAIAAGGDTDTHAAILGGWLGALHGQDALPEPLIRKLARGPFGEAHLRGLALAAHERSAPPRWSRSLAALRNLLLFPVILTHGLLRLARWPIARLP